MFVQDESGQQLRPIVTAYAAVSKMADRTTEVTARRWPQAKVSHDDGRRAAVGRNQIFYHEGHEEHEEKSDMKKRE